MTYATTTPTPERLATALSQLVRLCAADSTSGREALAVDVAEAISAELGLACERLTAAPGRDNLLIGASQPTVVMCTHLDTVPPFIAPRVVDEVLWGRGACDAKGVAIAMLHALDTVRLPEVAVLLVVGEETDHLGAKAVVASGRIAPRHVVLGEPCGMQPAIGQKGLLKLRLTTRGTAGHSAYPEQGTSALHHMIDALHRLRHATLPSDPSLGGTTVNVGEVHGGLAPNVIAPHAEATVLIRCAAPASAVLEATRELLGAGVKVEEIGRAEPIDFDVLGDEPGPAVPFNTDAGHLAALGAKMSLMGPGDMRCAHSEREQLSVKDLSDGIARYAQAMLRLT